MAMPITIEAQVKELLKAGWKKGSGHVWIAPNGAWKVMRGIDATGKVASHG